MFASVGDLLMADTKVRRLSDVSFSAFRDLILEKSGILFEESKRQRLAAALRQRMEAAGAGTFEEYYSLLMGSSESHHEMQELLDAITIQETQFFRNQPQFDALAARVLPRLITERKSCGVIGIWSAGCATGEEPYSLAMVLLQLLPQTCRGQIVATDISSGALKAANKGVYPLKAISRLPEHIVARFFIVEGDVCRVRDEVRSMVSFQRQNLFDPALPLQLIQGTDIIFCRNVLIYFSAEKRAEIVRRFFDILNPGGCLFLGHSETLWKVNTQFQLERWGEAFLYRKEARPAKRPGAIRQTEKGKALQKGHLRAVDARKGKGDTGKASSSAAAGDEAERDVKPGGASDPAFQQARTAMGRGEDDRALELLAAAVREDSLTATAYFLTGCIHQRRGEMEKAAKAFRKVLFLDPTCALAHLQLAAIFETKNDLRGALREYDNALKSAKKGMSPHWEEHLEGLTIESLIQFCSLRAEALRVPETNAGQGGKR